MKLIFVFIGVVIYSSQLRAVATESKELEIAAYLHYSDTDMSMNCTGFLADFSDLQDQSDVQFVTAKHCKNDVSQWDIYFNARVTGVKSSRVPRPSFFNYSRRVTVKSNSFVNTSFDAVFTHIDPQNFSDTLTQTGPKILKLSDGNLAVGDIVRPFGFPWGRGPIYYECKYLGLMVTPTSADLGKYILSGAALCDSAIFPYSEHSASSVIQGMSGGPILNSRSEVVGVISAMAQIRLGKNQFVMVFVPMDLKHVSSTAPHRLINPKPGLNQISNYASQRPEQDFAQSGAYHILTGGMANICFDEAGFVLGTMVADFPSQWSIKISLPINQTPSAVDGQGGSILLSEARCSF